MKVYTKAIDIKKQSDGSFTISIAVSDSSLVIKTITKQELALLGNDIEKLLQEN